MNKEFEKIIEKLEERRMLHADLAQSDKLTEQEREVQSRFCGCFCKAKEIVKQEAEKFGRDTNVYTNGWIPCNELLPAYGQTVLASVCAEYAEWKIIIACYKEEDFWLDGKIDAWQPLPTPYAKGE